MSDLFAGPIAKLGRAQHILNGLRDSVLTFRKRETYRIVMDSNADDDSARHVRIMWVYEELEPIPSDWSLIVSDLLHNLRSALDYAVWALSLRNVGANMIKRPNAVVFPIYTDEDHFNRGTTSALANVSDEDRTIIRDLQPFNAAPDAPNPHPLTVLHHLNRFDKHRELNIVLRELAAFDVGFKRTPPQLDLWIAEGAILEHGTVLAVATFPRPPFKVAVDMNRVVAYGEAIGKTSETPLLTLRDACMAMHHYAIAAVAAMDPSSR